MHGRRANERGLNRRDRDSVQREAVRHRRRHDITAGRCRNQRSRARCRLRCKGGLTEGLTSDFTYNTDFAQVEEDEQQVNLTRFSVLFPEKRDFFLEGQGIFSFGGVHSQPSGGGGNGGGAGAQGNLVPNDVPVMFFSRRIGLTNGVAIEHQHLPRAH